MILGVGCDVVNVTRVAELIEKHGDRFLERTYSADEVKGAEKYANDNHKARIGYFARRFAAKEAFAKAVGTGFGAELAFNEVGVVNDASGQPVVELMPEVKKRLEAFFDCMFDVNVSLSDDAPVALAFVVISSKT